MKPLWPKGVAVVSACFIILFLSNQTYASPKEEAKSQQVPTSAWGLEAGFGLRVNKSFFKPPRRVVLPTYLSFSNAYGQHSKWHQDLSIAVLTTDAKGSKGFAYSLSFALAHRLSVHYDLTLAYEGMLSFHEEEIVAKENLISIDYFLSPQIGVQRLIRGHWRVFSHLVLPNHSLRHSHVIMGFKALVSPIGL